MESVLVAFSKKTVAYFVNHASKTPLAVVVETCLCEGITLVILVFAGGRRNLVKTVTFVGKLTV